MRAQDKIHRDIDERDDHERLQGVPEGLTGEARPTKKFLVGDDLLGQLVYPAVDGSMSFPSIEQNGQVAFLTDDTMRWFMTQYAPDETIRDDPRLSPIRRDDLGGLPTALVITAEYDPLRDEGEAYGKRLAEAGVAVNVHRYDGMPHVFFQLGGIVPAGKEAIEELATAARKALAG